MRSFTLFAVCILGAYAQEKNPTGPAPSPAPKAKPDCIYWAATWEGAQREATIRNVPIVVLCSGGEQCHACRALEENTLKNESVITASAEMIGIAAHNIKDHKEQEVVIDGKKVMRCTIYKTVRCEDHIKTADVAGLYLTGSFGTPTMIWVDGKGKELFRRAGYRPPDQWNADLKAALDKMPGPRVSHEDYETGAKPLSEAEEALTAEHFREATEKFLKIADGKVEGLKKIASEGLEKIRKIADQLLKDGQAYLDIKDAESARPYFKLLNDEFILTESGKKGAELLKSLDVQKKDDGKDQKK